MKKYQHSQARLYILRYFTACSMVAAFLIPFALARTREAPASTVAVLALQIGYCGPIQDIDAAKTAGFDYFELRTSEVAKLSDDESCNRACNAHRQIEKRRVGAECSSVIVISNRFESFNSESWEYQGEATSAESCPGKSHIMSRSRRQSVQSGNLDDE